MIRPPLSRPAVRALALAAAAGAAGAPAASAERAVAQDLRQALEHTHAPLVRFSFPARPGICGAGDAILIREPDGHVTFINHRPSGRHAWHAGEPPCDTGDVVITAERDDGRFRDVRVRVGGAATSADRADPGAAMAVDLGRFGGQDAADALLDGAARAGHDAANRLILAASLADNATTWPALLRLGGDRTLAGDTRRNALFWLARQAGARAAAALEDMAGDPYEVDDVRSAAVFALSQLPADEAVPRLLQLGRASPDPLVRRRALFWLAQFDDPRVLDVFEEILSAPERS